MSLERAKEGTHKGHPYVSLRSSPTGPGPAKSCEKRSGGFPTPTPPGGQESPLPSAQLRPHRGPAKATAAKRGTRMSPLRVPRVFSEAAVSKPPNSQGSNVAGEDERGYPQGAPLRGFAGVAAFRHRSPIEEQGEKVSSPRAESGPPTAPVHCWRNPAPRPAPGSFQAPDRSNPASWSGRPFLRRETGWIPRRCR